MVTPPPERSSSPSPSHRSDLIRSFTTSSDKSASERLAAMAKAREERRKAREGGTGRPAGMEDDAGGVPDTAVSEELKEGEGKESGSSEGSSSLVPKLRVKSTSDRSYTPSIPSTPSQSSASDSPPTPALATIADDEPTATTPRAASPAPSSTSPSRSSFSIAEIPPYRPKTTSPAPGPSSPAPARTPSPGNVVLSGGLMQRLKAKRAAQAAKSAGSEGETTSGSTTTSTVEAAALPSTMPSVEPPSRDPGEAPIAPASSDQDPVPATVPPFSSPPEASIVRPASPTKPNRPIFASASRPAPIPAPIPSPPISSPKQPTANDKEDDERSDVVSELSRGVPDTGRSRQTSKIYGRDGEVFEYDFTELSDVVEQSERSSLSTWRDSLYHQHRRQGSVPTIDEPISFSPKKPASSSAGREFNEPVPSAHANPSSSGVRREGGEHVAASSSARRQPIPSSFLPSSASVKSYASSKSSDSSSEHQKLAAEVDRRVDATSLLLGRAGSTRSSIFGGGGSVKSTASVASRAGFADDYEQQRGMRNRSPTRRISPEVARRAAQFELPASPAKSPPPTPTPTPVATTTWSLAAPKPAQLDSEEEDPLVAIQRRRSQRQLRLETIRQLYAGQEDVKSAPLPSPSIKGETLSEIDQRERQLAEDEEERLKAVRALREKEREQRVQVMGIWEREEQEKKKESTPVSSTKTKVPSEPGSPRTLTFCEGYLKVPPTDAIGFADELSRPQDWVARYCVLTADTLEFRPTDQNRQSSPIVAFVLSECERVEDEPEKPFPTSFRPFAVVLRDGERLYFACDKRVERVRWVLALQDAVNAARARTVDRDAQLALAKPLPDFFAPSTPRRRRNAQPEPQPDITPPGSTYSSTRGTIRTRKEKGKEADLPPLPDSPTSSMSLPYGLYDFADDKKRPSSLRSGGSAISQASILFGVPVLPYASVKSRPAAKDLFSSSRHVQHLSKAPPSPSIRSFNSHRPLPALPPKDDSFTASHGHARSRSDLSLYKTPDDAPPFRPTPTRPRVSHAHSAPDYPPARARSDTGQSEASDSSSLSPEELALFRRKLRKALQRADGADSRARRQELQETLSEFQQLHGTTATSDGRSERALGEDLTLSEKVDYLMQMNKALLERLERQEASAQPPPVSPEEQDLVGMLENHIKELLEEPYAHPDPPPTFTTAKPLHLDVDAQTVTTRAGIHSASEKLDWEKDLRLFKDEARASGAPPPSSQASPTTMKRERDAASRRLEGLPSRSPSADDRPLPTRPPVSGYRLPIPPKSSNSAARGRPTSADLFGRDSSRPRDPFARSAVVQPAVHSRSSSEASPRPQQDFGSPGRPLPISERSGPSRTYSEWANARERDDPSQTRGPITVFEVEQLLWSIRDGFEEQSKSYGQNQQRQEQVSQVIASLAQWVAEDRQLRDAQHNDLVSAVQGVVQHVSELPQKLLATLQNAEPGVDEPAQPTMDVAEEEAEATDEQLVEADGDEAAGDEAAGDEAAGDEAAVESGGDGRMGTAAKGFGINPLSSFAAAASAQKTGTAAAKPKGVKGPRMPGVRLWGESSLLSPPPRAPEPVADRAAGWGRGAVAAKDAKEAKDKKAVEDALAADAEADKPPNGPIVEALKKDEKLGKALEALAAGEGTELDAGTLSLAVFEILQTMRELSKKQAEQEAKEAEEKAKNDGLTLKEKAELEAKKAEIARLEKETAMTAERTAKINEMVAQLAQKTDKTDALLAEIAKNVQEGKTTTMDPKLSEEVKKLLGGVQSGVNDHVADFRGKLTSEVQRMFKEVGKLRDEKKTLQTEIAELMAFQAKHGGQAPKSAAPPAAPAPAPAPAADDKPAPPPEPPKAGMPSSGWFGPRPMK